MPIQTPPQQPPVQPQPIYYPVPTEGNTTANEFNVQTPSESSSVSESENISSNSASLNAYQVNSAHEASYYKYENGTVMPGTSVYADLSAINDQWQWNRTNVVASVGIRHTFGGVQKRLAVESVARANLSKSLSVCEAIGVFDGKVDIDYEMMPHLQDCQYITQKVAVPDNSIAMLRAEMDKYRKANERLKRDNEAFMMRLTQMQMETKAIVSSF